CSSQYDVALDFKDVAQDAVVAFFPGSSPSSRIYQLDSDAHVFTSLTDAPFQGVGNAQSLGYPPHVALRSGRVSVHGSAVDDFEVRHLGERGANVILEAIGQKRVPLIFALILKWKHCDAFFGDNRH